MSARVPGTRAGVLLRSEQFELITAVLGAGTDAARARLLDVDNKTVYRARRGVIGEEFIAKTLAVLERHKDKLAAVNIDPTFESVFEVGEKQLAA